MSARRKARLAARLAAQLYGTPQKRARDWLLFSFDSEAISPDATVEALARAVQAAMSEAAT
jgi:hypothetical protein